MQRLPAVLAVFVLLLSVSVGGLSVALWSVSARLAALEGAVARGEAAPATLGADPAAIRAAVEVYKEARSGAAPVSEDEAVAMMEAALESALERKTEERKNAEVDRYMEMAEESIRMHLEDLSEDHEVSKDAQHRATELLVQGMLEGYQLQEDLKAGEITVREATEEGEVIKREYYDGLKEILGEEAYLALGEKFYPGTGWP